MDQTIEDVNMTSQRLIGLIKEFLTNPKRDIGIMFQGGFDNETLTYLDDVIQSNLRALNKYYREETFDLLASKALDIVPNARDLDQVGIHVRPASEFNMATNEVIDAGRAVYARYERFIPEA